MSKPRCQRCGTKTYRADSARHRCSKCGWFDVAPQRFISRRYAGSSRCGSTYLGIVITVSPIAALYLPTGIVMLTK
jgi:ribosomal protein L37E